MGIENITRDELLAELVAAITPKPAPEGWFSMEEIIAASSEPRETMRQRVYDKTRAGIFESMRIGSRTYYHLKKEA